ncbi:MAG: LysM peptidoglycan-binding domain-containing protein [Chloroflexota bacterium]
MSHKKFAALMVLILFTLSACNQPYSTAPATTPSPISTSLFATALPTGSDPMSIVAAFGTGTAVAAAATAGTVIPSNTPGAAVTPATATNTPLPVGVTVTPAPTTATPTTGPSVTPVPVTRPATYTLQPGEFPYCIARRFNVNPDELLALNGLSDGSLYMPGTTLTIPQTGVFPADRALLPHPATYTVVSSDETLYSIACLYGDVDPARIAQANNISLGTPLTVGQKLTIPQ